MDTPGCAKRWEAKKPPLVPALALLGWLVFAAGLAAAEASAQSSSASDHSASSSSASRKADQPPPPPAQPPPPVDPAQAQLIADTQRLLKLSEELKAEVAKSNKDMLSITVVKKAEEVELLAKSIKDRMNKSIKR